MKETIVIIGAGPTGLGCAWRLAELGHKDFHLFEANDYVGGLSASFKDDKGFTWDVGGHVLFSHYKYFDELFDRLLKKRCLDHIRESWIRIYDRFVPYPFQNNLRHLPGEAMLECLIGLHRATAGGENMSRNFREWILERFGEGIARHFMFPYNQKNWGYPLEKMSKDWIAERVSVVDFERILKNVILEQDDVSWGPNNTFKFPEEGGTGAFYRAFLPHLKGSVSLNKKCLRVNTETKTVCFQDGSEARYDRLITTVPLNEFVSMLTPPRPDLARAAEELAFTSGIMMGLGFSRPRPSEKNWVYFPGDKAPIYRLTYFSKYSPRNVPDERHFSLMGEVSYSQYKEIDKAGIINEFIDGMVKTGIIEEGWKRDIVSTSVIDVPYSYPVPSLGRNEALSRIVPELEKMNIHTRGRFGLWVYEIGNMDHSVMQGKELADALLGEGDEPTIAPYKFLQGEKK